MQISRSKLGRKKVHICLYRGHRVRFELIELINGCVGTAMQTEVDIPYLTGCYIIPTYSKCLYSALTNIKTNLNCVPCGSKIDKIC